MSKEKMQALEEERKRDREKFESSNGRKKSAEWRTFDMEKAVKQDLTAAISLLDMILNKPELLSLVIQELQAFRESLVKKEKQALEKTPLEEAIDAEAALNNGDL